MKTCESLRHILVSETRRKLINVLFYTPKEIFYVRQLVRLVDEEINSVRRELLNLKKAGLVTLEKRGNRVYYAADTDSSWMLFLLTLANRAGGLAEGLKNVRMLFYSLRFMMGEETKGSIDLVVVGEPSVKEVEVLIKKEEEVRGREINYMIMETSELSLRKQKRDPFIVDFFLNSPFVIIGSPKELLGY